MIEEINDLKFSLESSQTRASDFEEKYTQFRKEIQRVKEEEKNARERHIQSETIKENLKASYI